MHDHTTGHEQCEECKTHPTASLPNGQAGGTQLYDGGETTQHIAPSSELEMIKNEITAKLGEKNHKSLPFGNIAVTVMLGALTLVSIAQMIASVNIFNKLKTGEVKASSGAPQSNSVQSLPNMVGGC